MKVKYVGEMPIRYGDRLVNQGDELDIEDREATPLVASGLFEEIKKKTKKAKKADEPTNEGEE